MAKDAKGQKGGIMHLLNLREIIISDMLVTHRSILVKFQLTEPTEVVFMTNVCVPFVPRKTQVFFNSFINRHQLTHIYNQIIKGNFNITKTLDKKSEAQGTRMWKKITSNKS